MEKTMSPLAREKLRGPELTIDDLCKFVRSHFGRAAVHIAHQHVDAYKKRGHHDIAATWADVRNQLEKEDMNINRVA